MSIPVNRPTRRRPTHPGEMLREEFMSDYGLTVARLATAIGVSRQSVNELLLERRAMTADMALRLSKLFGTSPESWLELQQGVDLWDARQAIKPAMSRIKRLRVA